MKKIMVMALAFLLFILPGKAVKSEESESSARPRTLRERGVKEWAPLLKEIGVKPGENIKRRDYDLLLIKLPDIPDILEKVRRSSKKNLVLSDWIRILKGLGIQPKEEMSNDAWIKILGKAGVDLSRSSTHVERTNPKPLPVVRDSGADKEEKQEKWKELSSQTRSGGGEAPIVSARRSSGGSPLVPEKKSVPKVASKTISLDLRSMDIVEVLKIFSRRSGLSVVASPTVRGSVTLFLKDVEIWEALRLILETNGLAYVLDGTIVRVMTAADYQKIFGTRFDDKTEVDVVGLNHVKASAVGKFLESFKSGIGKIIVYEMTNSLIVVDTPESIEKIKEMVANLDREQETKVFSLNYAGAEELSEKIKPYATKDLGEFLTDKRTNRILVRDFPDKIRQMEEIVRAFDTRHRSVRIEAKILQVTLSKKFQMGVNWEYVFSNIDKEKVSGDVTGKFNILPVGSLGVAANLGTLAQNDYTAFVQMLETAGKTNLLSSPRITALNNEEAKILVGTKEAYVTTTVTTPGGGGPVTNAEQVNFVDVGVKLFVTPTIGEDSYITMKIRPEVSALERTVTTAQGNSIPIIRTSESETSVLARNGQTIMIAGLIEEKRNKNDSGVPFISRIPILGAPFRGRSKSRTKTEIVIFLTPSIVSGEDSLFPEKEGAEGETDKG